MNTQNEFLIKLLYTHTPSGYERLCGIDQLQMYVNTPNIANVDKIWNQYFRKGYDGEDALNVFISAHYDENALQVVNITKEGMLHIINLGGLDRKTIEGSWVYVISDNWDDVDTTTKKLIPGIIGKKPIHKESEDERKTVDEYDKIIVDIGANSADEVKELGIHVGSVIVFKKEVNCHFGIDQKKIVANALDDKIGIYCVTEAFNQINEDYLKEHKICLTLGWLTQEEVGLRGATIAGKLNPDISIDVDVTFDTSKCTAISKEKCGNIELGKGVVLEYGPHGQYVLMNDLKDIANKFAISYQEAVAKPGGNNCHAIQMNAKDCATAHLGIPQRNMHTQVEMCHWDDVLNCIDLIKNYIETL